MAVEIEIRQTGFLKKEITLGAITGATLGYGILDESWRLIENQTEGGILTLYDPAHIGRGVETNWRPGLKNHLQLRMPMPATSYDVDMLCDIVLRVCDIWDMASFYYGDEVVDTREVRQLRIQLKNANFEALANTKEALNGSEIDIMPCVMWPLHIRTDYLVELGMNHDWQGFAAYLHEHQAADFYYAVPKIVRQKDKTNIGYYVITANTDSILPIVPNCSLSFDQRTGKPIECVAFKVLLASIKDNGIIGELPYSAFASEIYIDTLNRFDEKHVILRGLSESRIHEIADRWRFRTE